jgi:hypothetical protein
LRQVDLRLHVGDFQIADDHCINVEALPHRLDGVRVDFVAPDRFEHQLLAPQLEHRHTGLR